MTTASRQDAFAILDMEWTTWKGAWARGWTGPGEFREVVEIGMTMVTDDNDICEIGSYRTLIKPIINPELSGYFIDLTGIRQDDVDAHGITLAEALKGMTEFLGGPDVLVYSHGRDGIHLRDNCVRIGTPFTFKDSRFINLNETIANFLERPKASYTSSDLPELMNFQPPGEAHTAVADCRCIAEALRILRAAGRF